MEEDLAIAISKTYIGDMVTSDDQDQAEFEVEIKRINNLTISIRFKIEHVETSFRALLSKQKEGILFRIQEKVSQDHMLTGVSGFLYAKPSIHGGFLSDLNGLYFHVSKTYFDKTRMEYYFLGKEKKQARSLQPEVVFSQLGSF